MTRATPGRYRPAALLLLACLAPWAAGTAADGTGGLATQRIQLESAPAERLLDGTVEAVHQSTVSAQTAGRVTEVLFDVNDRVPAGALIVRIRSTEQVSGLTQAQAALKEATAREAEAQTRYQRIHDMYQRRVVAKATLDEASAARQAPAWRRLGRHSKRRASVSHTPRSVRRTRAW